ncbi:hypothetical protein GMLC_02200 [Geomonas limicola]|uniref:DUF4124 domain-containing protein n=1 Tax=Geomonas limicola TaxID=2740186 RepID=A0A6V8N2J5_9BACT|nr:DUF4124 domain-containing protein [Geomonas limicola]GFO66641.1 hypothetical protein GMLC_02200 [Geomonas limicola]
MKMTFVALLFLLTIHSPDAQAAFYTWVDAQGVTHFTDNPDTIPAKYRHRAKEMNIADEPSAVKPPVPASPSGPSTQTDSVLQAEPASYGGKSAGWWRDSFAALRNRLKTLQDGLPEKQNKLAELRRKRIIYTRVQDRVAVNSMQAEVSADELHIAELQKQLADLDRQATQAGVPSELRQ